MRIAAVAWDDIQRIELIKNNAVFHTFAEPAGGRPAGGTVRFLVQWGWDARAPHEWQARLTLDRGHILQAIPCYRGPVAERKGTGVQNLTETECRWTSQTEKARYDGLARRYADAMAFEVECPEQAQLQLRVTCDRLTQELRQSARDILHRSTVRYMEPIPATNDGAYWHQMQTCAKFKVHRGWATDRLTVCLICEDDADGKTPGATDFYYVRLIQRNGQRAWSSPIWVQSS